MPKKPAPKSQVSRAEAAAKPSKPSVAKAAELKSKYGLTRSDVAKELKSAPKAKPTAKSMPSKRPAVGADKAAAKKYGSKSWNNGYTN